MKEIILSQGKVALVDDDMYDYLMQWNWVAIYDGHNWYAIRTKKFFGFSTTIQMHRVIVSACDGELVDHKDRDGLNNQRENLRICSPSENSRNRKKTVNNRSGYIGVHWHKQRGMYRAKTTLNGKHVDIGYFHAAIDAAHAYDEFSKKHFGEFANLNFPTER